MSQPRLFCTLVEAVVTDAGDFIPAGTPVELINGDKNYENVSVRAAVYMTGDEEESLLDSTVVCDVAGELLEFTTTRDNLLYLRHERGS